VFVTGHLKDGSMHLDWEALARPRQTVVVYMGLLGLPVLCGKLIEHGMPSGTPAAIVQQGTTRSQRVVTGTLETLPDLASSAQLRPPTLIIRRGETARAAAVRSGEGSGARRAGDDVGPDGSCFTVSTLQWRATIAHVLRSRLDRCSGALKLARHSGPSKEHELTR
jgi:hypothetical protein